MKINYKWITSLSLSATLLLSPFAATAKTITRQDVVYETVFSQVLNPGLIYEDRSRLTGEGWVDIHVLKMDLTNEYLELDILRTINGWGTKDTLTHMAGSNSQVIGGINASFFDMSKSTTDIIGIEYDENYASIKHNYNVSANGASSLINTTANGMLIDFLGATTKVTNGDGRELYLSGINIVSDLTNPIVFNTIAYKNSQVIDSKARLYKIVVSAGSIIEVAPPEKVVDIPEDGYIIAISEAMAPHHLPSFAVGMLANLIVDNTLKRDDIKLAISGGGKILKGGQLVAPNSLAIQPTKRNPRSAVGLTSDGRYLIMMVVDGRGSSIGATHQELANYLLEYSVSEAMHFDGGGSSGLIAKELGSMTPSVMNTPSDGSQRKIVNGLGVISTAPQGTSLTLVIKPSTEKVFLNMPVSFEIRGYDEYYNPVKIDTSNLVMVNKGITGKWNNQIFTPTSAGEGKIECQYGGVTATVTITCVDAYIDLDIQPKALQITAGQSGRFALTGTDVKGFKGGISGASVTWKIADASIGSILDGVFVPKVNTGMTKVTAQVSGIEVSAYVIVGGDRSTVTSFEDTVVTTLNFPETLRGTASSSSEYVLDGQKAIKLAYQYEASDQTQATYALLENVILTQKVQSLGLNVLGDNSHLYLRGKILDAAGTSFNITFTTDIDFMGWKFLEAVVPSEAVYPVQVERIYTAILATDQPKNGAIYFDFLSQSKYYDTSQLKFDTDKIIADPLISSGPEANDFVISVFGPTAGRNRLLDDVVLQKAYDNMNGANLALFAGRSNVSKSKVTAPSLVWDNKFTVNDYPNVRIITLATGSGGLVSTDANQWRQISSTLANTVQNNIIIVGNVNPQVQRSFSDQREGDLLHDVLSTYQVKTSKNIFYLNASGYKFDVDMNEGIRYIDLNGLWYNVSSDKKVDLNNSFNMLEFYIHGSTMNYAVKNLYPKVEIGQ